MEKRLVIFLICSVVILTGHAFLMRVLYPPRPVADNRLEDVDKGTEKAKPDGKAADPKGPAKKSDQTGDKGVDKKAPKEQLTPDTDAESAKTKPRGDDPDRDAETPPVPQQWLTLGSFSADSPYRLLVTFTNRGGAIERVELVERRKSGRLRYGDLEKKSGYLGLQTRTLLNGCVVKVVGAGTPAAAAKPSDGTSRVGIRAGDIIASIDGTAVKHGADLESYLRTTKPGQEVKLRVVRDLNEAESSMEFTATLDQTPLALVNLESESGDRPAASYLIGLHSLGENEAERGSDELAGFTSLRNSNWKVLEQTKDEIAFSQRLKAGKGADADELEFIKRFKIRAALAEENDPFQFEAYQLRMTVEVLNHGKSGQTVALAMDGPHGLPKEGWWYSNKIHPSWGAAGARDVIWRVHNTRHSLRSASEMYKQTKKDPDNLAVSVLTDNPTVEQRTLDYLGVDTQYFSAVLMSGKLGEPAPFECQQAYAMPVGTVPALKGRAVKTLNTTYRYVSLPTAVEPGKSWETEYQIFLGPKAPKVLAEYGLSDIIEYGWFGWIAKPLSKLLDIFYRIIHNYGLAIILLTVLVRGAMFPIGRKAARNAQVMQELAPEIKKIKEKYKNDLEKQGQAQRELWKKHNFNPLGGCWLMFLQLPIFIGLYRCLSVDINLRQASLIEGLTWCSNLAGPDMAVRWEGLLPGFLASENGWLGPYLNVLPIITIVLFIAQQKMFTPPATDDQTRMQQKMMKYMMIFMGVLFFKVPAGLCIYFIASSLWGIAERKLLPKPGSDSDRARKDPQPGRDPKSPSEGKPSLLQRLTQKPEADPAAAARARRKQRRR